MTILIIFLIIVFVFILYVIIDLLKTGNSNKFLDAWMRRTLWIWLPFFAIWRLIKEVFYGEK